MSNNSQTWAHDRWCTVAGHVSPWLQLIGVIYRVSKCPPMENERKIYPPLISDPADQNGPLVPFSNPPNSAFSSCIHHTSTMKFKQPNNSGTEPDVRLNYGSLVILLCFSALFLQLRRLMYFSWIVVASQSSVIVVMFVFISLKPPCQM